MGRCFSEKCSRIYGPYWFEPTKWRVRFFTGGVSEMAGMRSNVKVSAVLSERVTAHNSSIVEPRFGYVASTAAFARARITLGSPMAHPIRILRVFTEHGADLNAHE